MKPNTLTLVNVTADNFASFKELVKQQAEHHLCQYRGRDTAFLSEITDPESPARVMMAWCTEKDMAMGYVLYNVMYGLKGKDIYIEDILVRQDVRSQGVGEFFFQSLKRKARAMQADAVSWVVARNNERAIQFYTTKQNAKPLNAVGYDCTGILSSDFNTVSAGIFVSPICTCDIEKLVQRTDAGNGTLTTEKIRNIQEAAAAPYTVTFIAQDTHGTPLALMIANSNYSSFRTVYGYKVEMMELSDNPAQAIEGLGALLKTLTLIAKEKDHEGHINIFINPLSRAQVALIDRCGETPLRMSDHPNSYLDLYAIDRTIIHGSNPDLNKLDNVYQIDSYAKPGKFIIR